MSLNRRKALGALIGGAAAGPSAAKAAWEYAPVPTSPGYVQAYGGTECAKDNILDRIAQAKRIASGEILPHEQNYPTAGALDHYYPLKSMSEAAKRTLQNDRYERQWRARIIENAKQALAEYDQTGILRYFI